VRNALLAGERRQRLEPTGTTVFLQRLTRLPIALDRTPDEGLLLDLARRHRLTVYDTAYLELAVRRGLMLATLDEDLYTAATTGGLNVLAEKGKGHAHPPSFRAARKIGERTAPLTHAAVVGELDFKARVSKQHALCRTRTGCARGPRVQDRSFPSVPGTPASIHRQILPILFPPHLCHLSLRTRHIRIFAPFIIYAFVKMQLYVGNRSSRMLLISSTMLFPRRAQSAFIRACKSAGISSVMRFFFSARSLTH
jgi:hypothetical protein